MQQTPETLPIQALLEQLHQALLEAAVVVVEAPPGTGKTTLVPAAMLDRGWPGSLWVLEPRRLAARWAAHRVSQQRGTRVGQEVGYQVRLENRTGPETRLIYMTQGVFARRLMSNPQLENVSLVILDEFHERSLDNDLALAWLRRQSRVKILIMSATLAPGLAQRLGPEVPWLKCQSPLFPVAVQHQASLEPLEEQVRSALAHSQGSGLVFLPGMAEIRSCHKAVQIAAQRRQAEVQILHGSLESREQDRVLQADPDSLRWILATNVAETSLTVPGVRWVIDSGLARTPVQPPGAPLSRLETQRISKFSAQQRCGRAGRLGPGQCLRLYSVHDLASRPEAEVPEILRSDLSDLVLTWHLLGRPELDWIDPPPPSSWQAAEELLARLGALDERGLTHLGRAMGKLPLEPRLARFVLGYPRPEGIRAAAWLGRGGDARQGDLELYLIGDGPSLPEERQIRPPADWAQASLEEALLQAFPDRVARVRRQQDLILCDGTGYRLPRPLHEDWLLALLVEIDPQRQLRLSAYHSLSPESLLTRPELAEEVQLEWNPQGQRVESHTRLSYGQLVLEESRRKAQPGPAAAALLKPQALASGWWRDQLNRYQTARWRHHWALKAEAGLPPLPDLEKWLDQVCLVHTSLQELQGQRWENVLSPRLTSRLEALCPGWIQLGRRRLQVHYEEGKPPWIASRLADFFGLSEGPRLGQSQQPLVLHLLAPNQRPVQITSDLAGFWERHYPKIRSELSRRYPRHPWPVNPLKPAEEELRPKKRG